MGISARRVEVEAHLVDGVPSFVVVGLADRAVQEARQRVRSGITSAEYRFPGTRLTVNLAPAQERKEGSGFDLAIALGRARGVAPGAARAGRARRGGGRARPRWAPAAGRGALAMAEAARRAGSKRWSSRARALPRASAAAWRSSPLAISAMRSRSCGPRRAGRGARAALGRAPRPRPRGGARAAAGAAGARDRRGGPPQPADDRPAGSGKTMLARRLPGILPPPDSGESLEITRIHSAAGLLAPGTLSAGRARSGRRTTARRWPR